MREDRKVVVVGLGYVGIPVAVKLAEAGFDVTGIDVDAGRVEAVGAGRYPIGGSEPGLPELLARVVGSGRLRTSLDWSCVAEADVVFVNVNTPFDVEAFEPRYDPLRAAVTAVGRHMRRGALVIVESTIAPTTMERLVRPALEQESGGVAGEDFDLVHCPERVMPGKLLRNLVGYARVVGGITPASAERAARIYRRFVQAELDLTDMLTAELVKTTENTYRDVQIAFANEVAHICETLGADAWRVRELVNKVESRNVHLPGIGVGGHCIPKDPWLLAWGVKGRANADLVLTARRVNESAPARAARLVERVLAQAGRPLEGARVAILGASYLPGSDDTRNSPSLPLARTLVDKGATVMVCDPFARSLADLPFTQDVEEAARGADVVVLATAHPAYLALDWRRLAALMRTPCAVDGRNGWHEEDLQAAGFRCACVGRGEREARRVLVPALPESRLVTPRPPLKER